jgi:hypothetical protein
MNSNVAPFESFDTDQQIAAHQAGLVRVVLEGASDVKLFSRFWFSSMVDTFEFIEAGKVAAGAGCTGVADAVAHSLGESVPAIGIVDRDTLFRSKDWTLLFSIDQTLMNANWLTTKLYVTSLWEVEAYLLEPDLLAQWVAAAHRSPPGTVAECERALLRTLDECEVLLGAAPYFAAQHEGGKSVPPGFCYGQPKQKVIEVCDKNVAAAQPNVQATAAQVKALVDTILESQPVEHTDRLPFLLRYVDTKRLLNRLLHALKVREETHWILAQFMLNGGRRPTELEQILRSIEAAQSV